MAVGKTGGTVLTTEGEFDAVVLQSTAPVLVFFTAPWCGPCRLSIPVVKQVLKDYSDQVRVVEVCTDDLPAVAEQAGVVSIPTIQMYAQAGRVLDTIVGCVAKSVLSTAVEKVLEDVAAASALQQQQQQQQQQPSSSSSSASGNASSSSNSSSTSSSSSSKE